MKKFELMDETFSTWGKTVHRIRALKDFGDVKAGDLGGFVMRSENLSQEGDCWIYDDAIVYGGARIEGNAKIYENATVCGVARVTGNVLVRGSAIIHGFVDLGGSLNIEGNADISSDNDYATIRGFGSENRETSFYFTRDNDVYVVCGCFQGTLQEFRDRVRKVHGYNLYAEEYLMLADLMEKRFNSRINFRL